MSKTQEAKQRGKGPPVAGRKVADKPAKRPMKDGIRETVESVVIAFVLAFLFRTFEAEAFVIPTGSMATTLRGQHKDLKCQNCRFPFQVSASEEEPNEQEAQGIRTREQAEAYQRKNQVVSCVCPNCGFEMDFDAGQKRSPTSFKGDRILVSKFAYEFDDPRRWDVAVFHFPLGAHQNYIKRLVGVPDETIVIHRGDVLTTDEDLGDDHSLRGELVERMQREGRLQLQRKPSDKVQAMLQVVYDNQFALADAPQRWRPVGADTAWQPSDDGRAFETDGASAGDDLLVYEHRVPTPEYWAPGPRDGPLHNPDLAAPQLITDFYGYNMGTLRDTARHEPDNGTCWLSDLALDCQVEIKGGEGELVLGLVEADCLFECRIDVASGEARFSSSADAAFQPSAPTRVRGPGSHRLQFANVDDQLLLWVDGKSVPFAGEFTLTRHYPGQGDLQPLRMGSRGVAVRVDHLRVLRDVYYRATWWGSQDRDLENYSKLYLRLFDSRDRFDDDRQLYWRFDRASWPELFRDTPAVQFKLGPDQFLMLGDNSPRSSDSRLWENRWGRQEYYVKRELLIGKALYIYWPHALDHLPGTEVWFPFFPDFGRMGLVR
jgi:signal peptidase I